MLECLECFDFRFDVANFCVRMFIMLECLECFDLRFNVANFYVRMF